MAKIHRFIDNFDLKKEQVEIEGEIAKQIKLVLKLKIGEKIELCDGKNIYAIAEISIIDKKSVLVKILERHEIKLPTTKVNLFCAILKKENFELVVQKATECNASKIIPIITSRTVKTGLNIDRLQKIAKEASEQSGRIDIPEILEPINFEKSLKLVNKEDANIIFDINGEPLGNLNTKSNVNIFIGPEGGWTTEEMQSAKENNFKIYSLGHLTLRGETAAIIATYLVSNI